MVRLVAIAWLLGACAFDPPGPGAAPGPDGDTPSSDASPIDGAVSDGTAPASFHLRIEVLVDGWSYLKVKGSTLHWEHHVYAAPGRWQDVIQPTKLNGVDWFPTWPDVPTVENRDCGGCVSSLTELPISVPRVPSTTTINEVQVRRAQDLIQAPAAANDYELIVRITDFGQGGGANYIVEVDVTPTE